MGALLKGQGHKAGTGSVQVLIHTALGMNAVKAAHHIAVHHVDHGFGHRVVDAFIGQHAFLDDDLVHFLAVFDHTHFVAGFAVQRLQIGNAAHRHDAHAIGSVVGFDDDKRFFVDAKFFVFASNFGQQHVDIGGQAFHARALGKIHLAALREHGVDQPRVYAEQLAKALGHFFVVGEMLAFASHTPTRMQWRQQVLLVQVFQDAGDTSA